MRPSDASGAGKAGTRLVYVDNLRAIVIGLVLVVHVAEVFNPWDEWHITNDVRSRAIGEVAVLLAPWIMPLVMLLAGVSAWHSLRHRSNAAYIRERILRVLVPLVIGTLILVPPQVYLERRLRGQTAVSFLAFLPHFFDGIYPRGNFSWHHLWFLAHLFVYSLVAIPIFRFWQGERGRHQLARMARVCGGSLGILWLALPLVIERQLLWGVFPERHMLAADWSNHALLLVAYLYGFLLSGEGWLGAAIDAQWRATLGVALSLTAGLMAGTWFGFIPGRIPPPYSWRYLLFWTAYAVGAWAWMVAVLGAGRRWLTRDTPVLRYGHEMSYGWYLVHQPIIVAVAFVVVPWQWSVGAKAALIFCVSAAGTLAVTEVLRRIPIVADVVTPPSVRRAERAGGGRGDGGPPPVPAHSTRACTPPADRRAAGSSSPPTARP
jgi:peptidoglycan/LPS O-acetylase OafA/YrhL